MLALYTATACGRSVMPVETSFMQPSSVKQKVIEDLPYTKTYMARNFFHILKKRKTDLSILKILLDFKVNVPDCRITLA
jgi:hypothetical protein